MPRKKILQTTLLIAIAGILLTSSLTGNFISPASADNSTWTIQITNGEVANLLTLSLADLAAMPQTTVYADLNCYGALVTSGNWGGVSLSYLLQKVGINHPESVVVKASDGYSYAIPLETAFREDVIIAYQKDGQPLSEVLRLVIPGANGDMWVAQITQIMLIAPPYDAHSPSPSPTPQQMPTTPPSPTAQPKTNGNVSSPVVPPAAANSHSVNGASGSGSSWLVEYAYLIVAVVAAAATVTLGYSFYKRRGKS